MWKRIFLIRTWATIWIITYSSALDKTPLKIVPLALYLVCIIQTEQFSYFRPFDAVDCVLLYRQTLYLETHVINWSKWQTKMRKTSKMKEKSNLTTSNKIYNFIVIHHETCRSAYMWIVNICWLYHLYSKYLLGDRVSSRSFWNQFRLRACHEKVFLHRKPYVCFTWLKVVKMANYSIFEQHNIKTDWISSTHPKRSFFIWVLSFDVLKCKFAGVK